MWGRKPKKSQDNPQNEAETRLVSHLEGLQYRADPQFRRDLKNRLLTSLEQSQAGPVRPVRRPGSRRWSAASSVGLALGGLGLAALLLVVVSVLSVRSNEGTVAVVPPTEVAVATVETLPSAAPVEAPPVAPRGNIETTSEDEPTATAVTTQPVVALSLFNPANGGYISTTTATGLVGFSVRPPTYLPTGYTLEAASVQTTTTQLDPASPEISGYYLRYSAALSGSKMPPPTLEISQWKVPFNFKPPTPSAASPGGAARRVSPPPVIVLGVSRAHYLTIHSQSAYMIEGANWTIWIMNDGGKANPPGRITPGGFNNSGSPTTPSTLKDGSGSPVRFGRLAADRPDYFIEFGHKTEPKNTKALIWQKDNVLNVVNAADNVSLAELQKVAESF